MRRVAGPTGLVTFLFSDIEGSTQRWETHKEAMRVALRRHDEVVRSAIERNGGRVFKTMGDQFCAAFWTPPQAVASAAAIIQGLAEQDFRAVGGLKVRIAVHTGVTDERDGDYFGPAVNRVARLLAAGHGGQVLLSSFAAEMSREHLPHGSALRDLGTHRLKDLAQPERIWQLVATLESPKQYPQLRALGAPSNLPETVTPFVGRHAEIGEIVSLLEQSRLVTLVGPGGVGKTRTALRVAEELLDRFEDGAWFVELAPVAEPERVLSAIAAVFHVGDQGPRDFFDSLSGELKSKTALLVLDNCEHVIDAAAQAAERLLHACPNLRVLATSREALRIDGERTYHLPSLDVPSEGALGAREALAYPSVSLFVDRARSTAHTFGLNDNNAAVVAEIVRRLDGLPLAIELAAARVSVLPVDQLAARLDERFDLLTGGRRTALPRQQTLRALIDWSYDLLDATERAVLARLSVFRGGWTLEAATEICAGAGVSKAAMLDVLSKLVDKSLVILESGGSRPRYTFLESTREYARERLFAGTGYDEVCARHCKYFRSAAGDIAARFWDENESAQVAALRVELDNYRAAITWALLEGNDVESGAAIVADLAPLWRALLMTEGAQHLERALAAGDDIADDIVRARLLMLKAAFTWDGGLGVEAARKAVEILRHRDEPVLLADALRWCANSTGRSGKPAEGLRLLEEALAIARPLGNARLTVAILNWYGYTLAWTHEPARSHAAFDEAIALARQAGDVVRAPLANFAELLFAEGDVARAIATSREAIAIIRDSGNQYLAVIGLGNLAAYLLAAGDLHEAWLAARESMELGVRQGRYNPAAIAMQHLAQIAARTGDTERAARLTGYSDAVFERENHKREPTELNGRERIMAILSAKYAPGRVNALIGEGRSLGDAEAVALAMEVAQPAKVRSA